MTKTPDILPTHETIRHLNAETIFSPSGKLLSARTRNRYVMEVMNDLGFLDHAHLEAATMFLSLKAAFLAPCAFNTSKLSDEIATWLEQHGYNAPDAYQAISRALQARQIALIEWAATTLAPEDKTIYNAIYGDVCYHAFESLLKALDATHKTLAHRN